ncbi:MAG: phosphatidylserine decarboxylase family protein [Planctomycetota bacterium]|nr:MAG: phosphatidylserine decarboxylase family protein [Planctomycetota bacterium]
MPDELQTIQPGGGVVMRLELAWGRLRRWYLRRLRPGYVRHMAEKRKGSCPDCPHDIVDPRDLKYVRNRCGYYWEPEDDPFAYRDRLPFARAGLAELVVLSIIFFGTALGLGVWLALAPPPSPWRFAAGLSALAAAVCGVLVVWFFRDPPRTIPAGPGLIVSPADGKVVSIERIDDEYVGRPALTIGIFLSIFNVHLNRSPADARVVGLKYKPGKCLNALRPESARENESLSILLEDLSPHRRPMIVRQITGAIARRIVCWVRPGQILKRGERLGMIKLGSRTELILPDTPDLRLEVAVGARVRAGASVLARYADDAAGQTTQADQDTQPAALSQPDH